MNPINYTPSHPEQFEVEWGPEGTYGSRLITLHDIVAGTVLARLGPETRITEKKAYTSVQFRVGEDPCHFELGSDLVYINHSCNPNVAFELPNGAEGRSNGEWLLRALWDIKKGEPLSFAYFSTEWDMAQPFDCQCGSAQCLGRIQGAKYIPESTLKKYFINDHILSMKRLSEKNLKN